MRHRRALAWTLVLVIACCGLAHAAVEADEPPRELTVNVARQGDRIRIGQQTVRWVARLGVRRRWAAPHALAQGFPTPRLE